MYTPRRTFGPWTRSPLLHTPEGTASSSSKWSLRSISRSSSESTGSTAFWRTPRKEKEKGMGKVVGRGGRWMGWMGRKLRMVVGMNMRVRVREGAWKCLGGWRNWGGWWNRWKLRTRVSMGMKRGERNFSASTRRLLRLLAFIVGFCLLSTSLLFFHPSYTYASSPSPSSSPDIHSLGSYKPIRPTLHEETATRKKTDPIKWLQENSNNRHAITPASNGWSSLPTKWTNPRPKAALISLVRNSELEGMIQSMTQLEARWNHKYQYPWIFFNDEPFTAEFMAATKNVTDAPCYYEVVPKEYWEVPEWIDEGRFMNSLDYLGTIGVGKGWMVSYHHMCRWNSGFFYRMERLRGLDWYWRVEPDVHFFCNINYDIFRFMRDNNLKYGFNMNILDDARSFPSLWAKTRAFAQANPQLLHPDADLDWLLDAGEYNNCQFFSNFEVGSLRFWRGEDDDDGHQKYFDYLDRSGGFYYERWGDAPVHTLSVAMFLPKSQVWFFGDVGYQHGINSVCPRGSEGMCACEGSRVDEGFYKLVPIESPQRKPRDTCIRQWLGGEWVRKREGWRREVEVAWGGDGFGGYMKEGDEEGDEDEDEDGNGNGNGDGNGDSDGDGDGKAEGHNEGGP